MKVYIKKPFNEQYTLVIESDMMGVDVHMVSRSQMRWDFSVLKTGENSVEARLVLLDHILLESNNPLIKEVAEVSQVFSRMYNELHLVLDEEGKVREILNTDIILDKWIQTKNELEKVLEHSPDIKGIIQLNDSIFADPKKIKQAIQANEFINTFFGNVYGKEIPNTVTDISRPNFFNTANVQWEQSVSINDEEQKADSLFIKVKARPAFMLTEGFYNRAYAQFAEKTEISKLYTLLAEEGKYEIDSLTGKVIQAAVSRKEEASPSLYTRMKFTLMSDPVYKEKLKEQPEKYKIIRTEEQEALPAKELTKNGEEVYKVYKGKKYSESEWKEFEEEEFKIYAKKHNIKIEKDKDKFSGSRFFISEKKEEK